ncbi:MAG: hypothetical protein JOZ25_10000 [Actinobacteria bacterium]|nr:hypothetical protein [Actinomycetota bacterium]
MRVKMIAVGAVVSGALMSAAPAALAVSPAQQGYSFPAGSVQEELGQNSNSTASQPAQQSSEGTEAAQTTTSGGDSQLPFTGMDVGLVVGAGGVLVAMGLGIRRLSRTPSA